MPGQSYVKYQVKFQVKGYGWVSCPERLAVAWDHFGTRSDIISLLYSVPCPLTLNLTLKVKFQAKNYGCRPQKLLLGKCLLATLQGGQLVIWDYFGTRAIVISGRYSLFRLLALNLILKVKCYGCVCRPGRPAIVWGHFGARADVTLGRYPILCPLTLNLTFNIKLHVKGLGCVSCPRRLVVVWDYLGTRLT